MHADPLPMSKVFKSQVNKYLEKTKTVYSQQDENKYISTIDRKLNPSRNLVIWTLGALDGKLLPMIFILVPQFIIIRMASREGYALHKFIQCLIALYIMKHIYQFMFSSKINRIVDKKRDDGGYPEIITAAAKFLYMCSCILQIQLQQLNQFNKTAILENILVFGMLLLITRLFSFPIILTLLFIAEIGYMGLILIKKNPILAKLLIKARQHADQQLKKMKDKQEAQRQAKIEQKAQQKQQSDLQKFEQQKDIPTQQPDKQPQKEESDAKEENSTDDSSASSKQSESEKEKQEEKEPEKVPEPQTTDNLPIKEEKDEPSEKAEASESKKSTSSENNTSSSEGEEEELKQDKHDAQEIENTPQETNNDDKQESSKSNESKTESSSSADEDE